MNELNIGEIIVDEEINIGSFELDIIKELPKYESLEIMPTTEQQVKEGSFNKVTVAGDENLKAENISKGATIFGVEGTANTTNAKITNCYYLFGEGVRLDYLYELLAMCEDVTNMGNMFYRCYGELTDIDLSTFDTSKVTNMANLFTYCTVLKSLDLSSFNTSNVTSMTSMFNYCSALTSLDVSNFDTSNVTSMSTMFYNCSALTSLNLSSFNTSNVTNMNQMFYNCSALTSLDVSNFDTSNVTTINQMFERCSKLTSLDLSNFDLSKVTSVSYIFRGCTALKDLTSFTNLGKGYTQKTQNYSNYRLDLSTCTALTHESLMSVINNLYDLNLTYDVANGGTLYRQQLILGNTNLAKLTAEEIALATNKGWIVS